ncbi:MAG: sulfatase-like hydrolase/transferase [Phycisphaera sp.]|nr:sulfatase-like hydrolase/transferase [Phycisphaera sp.]
MSKPSRRPLVLALCLLAATIAACHGARADAASRKPNIIYVMIDDAGYGDFGAFGSKDVHTPVFDRMCAEGTKFTQHYSGSAVCAPTRCVLMTGLHTGHCRRRDNQAVANRGKSEGGLVFLEKDDLTVATTLKSAGYATGGIGKWGLGNPGSDGVPEKHGFDYFFGYLDQVHAHDYYTDHLWDSGSMVDIPENKRKPEPKAAPGENAKQAKKQKTDAHDDDNAAGKVYTHDLFEQRTLQFIRDHKDEPFFLYLPYTLPHGNYVIPHDCDAYKPYADKAWNQTVRNYAAMITRADETVGKMLDLLKQLNLDNDTIVFYTSDNGPNPPFLKDLNSGGGLRGIKRELYEGGLRAAMVVRWPGRVPAGRTSDFQWGMRDVFPTLCDIAGVDTPKDLDGISVLPTLTGKPQAPRDHMYWEIHHPFQQAVRMGNWKGIRFGTKEPIELYNLAEDPGERHDVASENPAIVERIASIMDGSHVDSPFWPVVENKPKAKPKKQANPKNNNDNDQGTEKEAN